MTPAAPHHPVPILVSSAGFHTVKNGPLPLKKASPSIPASAAR